MVKLLGSLVVLFLLTTFAPGAYAQQTLPGYVSVIDQWSSVVSPQEPTLHSITADPATTALLILDMETQLVSPDTHPRAWSTVPFIANLLDKARKARVLVVYSLITVGAPGDIVVPLAPQPGDPVVKAPADKFFHTDLEKILTDHGIKTVVVTGTAANGAVLNTASQASLRGMKVVVPVDGMSNDDIYAEQYTCYHLLKSPATRANSTLSRTDLINF